MASGAFCVREIDRALRLRKKMRARRILNCPGDVGRGWGGAERDGTGRGGVGRSEGRVLGADSNVGGRRLVTCADFRVGEMSTNGSWGTRQSRRRAPEGAAACRRRPDPASMTAFTQFFLVPFFYLFYPLCVGDVKFLLRAGRKQGSR